MEEKLKTLLQDASEFAVLDDEIPGDITPSVTYHFIGEEGAVYGAGRAKIETISVQVSIWYKRKTNEVKATIKQIKEAIADSNKYSWPVKQTQYDNGNKVYQTYYTFDIIKESEE